MKYIQLTQDKKALVDEDDYSYLIIWKWCFNHGYAVTTETSEDRNKRLYMHRLVINARKGLLVDHINNNKLDNRKSNLRVVTTSQNGYNRKKHITGTSVYKGVTRAKGRSRYRAGIKFNKEQIDIGYFREERHAAMAYDIWAKELFGEFANLNF